MFVQRNTDEVRSCYHCCSGNTISITYSESVFVDFGIQYAMRMRHIVTCDLLSYTLSHKQPRLKKKKVFKDKMYVLIFLLSISHSKKK